MQKPQDSRFSDEEMAEINDLIQQQYPDEDVVIVYDENAPAARADQPAPVREPTFIQKAVVVGLTAIGAIYLVNPTAGVLELIPDVVPVIGNLDEATAMAIVISGMSYLGINVGWLTSIFGPGLSKRKRRE